MGRHLPDSHQAWPDEPKPPTGAPNVLVWLLDDAGFGLLSAFGGLVPTPTLESLAANGLRYTNFHSTPLCSPSRVSLLTGRNPHAAHMGSHGGTSMGFPGYDGFVPPTAGTTAKVLRTHGYSTMAIGKWDHAPFKHQSPVGPFELWPLGQGFEHFYGFLWHDTDHFNPTLVQDNSYVTQQVGGKDYYFTTDMAKRAIGYVNSLNAVQPERPFYLYWATGAVHSPHQATAEWREKFRGKFDMGWDKYREQVLKRQKAMGLVPGNTKLAPLQGELPAWSSLSADQKKLYARQMEVMAAQMAQADYEFGRIIDALRRNGQLDNTLIIVTSDNGGSAEGGVEGAPLSAKRFGGQPISLAEGLQHYDDWGGASTMPHYSAAWTVATNTPFRYYKQTAHEGGHRVPLIISWQRGIKERGLRHQYSFIADLSPTILAAADIAAPACLDGVPQQPIDGIALNYSFDAPRAPARRTTQYYELWGNYGIYHEDWKAVVLHKKVAWDLQASVPFNQDKWELYDLRKDPGETRDLAAVHPEKLAELQRLFDVEARQNNVFPLADLGARNLARAGQQFRTEDQPRTVYSYRQPGTNAISEMTAAPTAGRSHDVKVTFSAKPTDQGALVAVGGVEAGYALFVKDGRLHYENYEYGNKLMSLSADLPSGKRPITAELRWTQESRAGGTMVLLVNGREVARDRMSPTLLGGHGSNELFNVGLDTGAPATPAYKPPFAFTGTIEDVTFTLRAPAERRGR